MILLEKRNLLIIHFFLIFSPVLAQLEGFGEENLRQLGGEGDEVEMVQTYDNRYDGIKGSPFLFDEWSYGQILTVQNQKFDSVQMKYDLYSQNLLYRYFKEDREIIKMANPDVVEEFVIYDPNKPAAYLFDRLEFVPSDSETKKVGYFQVLQQDSNYLLLLKREASFHKANYKGAYNYGNTYDEFKKSQQLYVLKENDRLFKLNNNKKSVLRAFKDQRKSIKNFIKAENINFNDNSDLIRIFNYYVSL